jgi:hypothetical protein
MGQYHVQNNFTAGELSPRMHARPDFDKYKNGCATLTNWVVYPHGGVTRRPGTHYVKSVKTPSKATRLKSFVFSATQSYVLEFGDGYFRVYRDGGRIEVAGVPVEVATPYSETEVFDLQFAQINDILYLAHYNYAPRKITRTSDTAWAITTVDFLDGPYLDENDDKTRKLTVSANTGTGKTMTASGTGFTPFTANHVGSLWRLKGNTTYGYVKITAYTSSTVVTVDILKDLDFTTPGTTTTSLWREGAWGAVKGWPACLTIYEQRAVYASTSTQPQTVWGTRSADYEDFTPGTNDDDAYTYTLGSNEQNTIQWLVGSRALLIGTTGGEFAMSGGNGAPITPSNVNVTDQTRYGCAPIVPVRVEQLAIFVQRDLRKVRALNYDVVSDAFKGLELSLLAEHITAPGIFDLAYQQSPDSTLWMALTNGALISCAYYPTQEVAAWQTHTSGVDWAVESLAVIPNPNGGADQVWMVVRRTLNGATARYVEYLDPSLYVDSGLTYSGVPGTSVSGLSHLEGVTVTINGDGAVYPPKTVTGGSVALDGPSAGVIQVGIPYTSTLTTLRPEIPTQTGTVMGRPKRYAKVWVRVLNTRGLSVNGQTLSWRSSGDVMNAAPPLESEDVAVSVQGWDRDAALTISHTQPEPVTVLAVHGYVEVGD